MSADQHELLFRKWLTEHTGLLLKVVRSFADGRADEDDLFQEILLQLWISLPNFREESKSTTWIYRVALNTALAWKRREGRQRRERSSLPIADVADTPATSSEAERNGRIVDQLYAAIHELPLMKRALVVLYLDGFSYRAIGDVVGISESNVGVSLNRIKKELAEKTKESSDVL